MSLILRTCAKDGTSHNGFRWPLTAGAIVEAPDWDHKPECGNGLHGALRGEGNGDLFAWAPDAVWMVVEANDAWIVDLGGKVKFPACVIRHVGDQRSATDYIMAHEPLARAVIGAFVTSGYRGTSTSGYGGTSTSGYGGTSTSGDGGTSTSGYRGTSTSGYGGTSTSGDRGTSTSGYGGTSTSGYRGTSTSGYRGTSTSGDGGTSTSGYGGTSTSGDGGTSTSGYGGTSTSGYRGILQIKWYDGYRYRIATAYVGEDGILPNVPYKLDDAGKFVRADK